MSQTLWALVKPCHKMPPEKEPYFKFCPETSVHVERSLLAYKLILGHKRHTFALDNHE